jgi:hypothetical protein
MRGMADDAQIAALARQAFGVAGQLQLLAENMTALSRQPDGYRSGDLTALANTLRGFALRNALSIGDTVLMEEIGGRSFRPLDGGEGRPG